MLKVAKCCSYFFHLLDNCFDTFRRQAPLVWAKTVAVEKHTKENFRKDKKIFS
jgi:hypothetical protein